MFYSERFIVSGGIFEYYSYDRLICTGRIGAGGMRRKGVDMGKYRTDTFQRAKKEVRRLVNCNLYNWTDNEENRVTSKFLTLTFKENVQDIDDVNKAFAKFVQRLNYNLGYKIKYLSIVEFQKRGAIHYHVIIFNMPYKSVADLRDIWGYGFVKINKIDGVTNVGAYVCKYMTKPDDDKLDRLKGRKMYFKSTGLLEPEIITDYDQVLKLKGLMRDDEIVYKKSFEAPFLGNIDYIQYNIDKKRGVKK